MVRAIDGRAVLVGGQAVAWWAAYYAHEGRLGRLTEVTDLFVSRDADFALRELDLEKRRALLKDVALRLRGRSKVEVAFGSLVLGTVEFTDSKKRVRMVDFLRDLNGVSNRQRIFDEAVAFEAEGDLPECYVMHPLMLLETRVANVAQLEKYRTEVGVLQAEISLDVAREWLNDRLDDGWDEARKDVERAIDLAESKHGIRVAARHAVDVLRAVPSHRALPKPLVAERLPRARAKLERAIASSRASSEADRGG